MQHFCALDDVQLKRAWVTIGSFDGVHIGHQAIIRNLTAGAHQIGVPAVVLTFDPHPAVVLRPEKAPTCLTSPLERAEHMAALGVDALITLPFTKETATQSAQEFINALVRHLDVAQLWVGHDFALGRNREGNIQTLQQLGEEHGYILIVIPPVMVNGNRISSSLIRQALHDGQLAKANDMLGYPYRITGEVIHGKARGRSLGFPTANIAVHPRQQIPKAGVYVCQAAWQGKTFPAVTNIGVRPTFENGQATASIESHILNFSQDLYGEQLQLDFLSRIRDEQRFPNVEALIAQVNADIETTRAYFG